MYVDTLMLVVGVSLFSITFSIIQWGVNKGLDELYNKLINKNADKGDFSRRFQEVHDLEECECDECVAEREYYVAEREDK